jgi:hypothetical protein
MSSKGQVAAAAIGALATVAAAVLVVVLPKVLSDDATGSGQGHSSSTDQLVPNMPSVPDVSAHTTAELFANKESAPVGATVLVSGRGFQPGERVEIRVGADLVATTTAGQGGDFANVAIEVPSFFEPFTKPMQVDINATGKSSVRSAIAAFTISG